ncbi:lipocalin family protein [Paraburkholderia sp. BR10872]|uniref:lipocalin family protein n=1 Tax=Paraburkholderia sp. BR10872 TaxID=3236989 RepID=UPI0034D2FF7B
MQPHSESLIHRELERAATGAKPAATKRLRPAVVAVIFFLLVACATRTSNTPSDAVSSEASLPALQPVPVDLTRYMGRWYTIATVPYLNEREYVGSYADWELREDGRIDDNYFGRRYGFDQPVTGGTLVAAIVPGSGGGRWRVTILWPFNVVVLTVYVDPDYRYTVRCEEDGSPIWILSRTPAIDDNVYAGLVRRLAAMGIHTEGLRRVPQHPEQIGQPGYMAPR